jgi:transcriptional regulator with XRE-family HTH domain
MAKSIGAALREARTDAGLSQSAVTNAAGLAPGQLSQIESGRSASPEFTTVARVAAVLGLSLHELAKTVGLPTAKADGDLQGSALLAKASEALRIAATGTERLNAQLQAAHSLLLKELPASRPVRRRKR